MLKTAGAVPLDADSSPVVTKVDAGDVWIVDKGEPIPFGQKKLRLILKRHFAAGGSVLVTMQQSPESALTQALA